jgi:sterol desaturase/sphingolipid hydroxylase (fatty acid hydroxylase superfamily)
MREFYSNFPLIALFSLPRFGIAVAAASAIFLLDSLIRPRAAFRSRRCLHDVLYYLFYNSIFYTAIVVIPVRRLFLPLLGLFNWHVLAALPALPRFIIFFLAVDFAGYWHHRWMHTRFLWGFHSMHHEQRELTVFTSRRKHVAEEATTSIMMLGIAAVLGSPPEDVLWFFAFRYLKDATLHSGLPWRYGPLYWIVVSPVFHSNHHSIDVAESNSNFGVFFSSWDILFGTHHHTTAPPETQGVEGLAMPTLWSQFVLPWKIVRQSVLAETTPEATSTTAQAE